MPLETLQSQDVHIDEQCRSAMGTVDWLLEHCPSTHPFSADNGLEVLACGAKAFGKLAADIESARHSIDIVCWGFDPAMELMREPRAWPRGLPYGALLDRAVKRGVLVRLLTWHESGFAAKEQNNMPGYTGDQRSGYLLDDPVTSEEQYLQTQIFGYSGAFRPESRTAEECREDYCVTWWRRVLGGKAGIECKFRRGDAAAVRRSLVSEADKPSASASSYGGMVNEKKLIEKHATHHQKTVLIDYAWEEGRHAVGYVMGLNSLTDYWDNDSHAFDSPLREIDWARKSETAQSLGRDRSISRDPYRDYACRVIGPVLRGVNDNFLSAWVRAGGKVRADDTQALPAAIAKVRNPYRAQIVRTQPEEGDKTIQLTYWHAPIYARRYIYIENQYFFYETWARELKNIRKRHVAELAANTKSPLKLDMLHLFVVTPQPENAGMLPRTYDMVKSLGEGNSLPGQQKYLKEAGKWEAMREKASHMVDGAAYDVPENDIVLSANRVEAPIKNLKTGELEGLAMKVLIARLISVNRGAPLQPDAANVRQVYIHSKLMLIDDSYFTLGSANLSQRSMAADSELNIATDDHREARSLRSSVWATLSGNTSAAIGGNGTPDEIALAFNKWKDLMANNDANQRRRETRNDVKGFIVPFRDDRSADYRVG